MNEKKNTVLMTEGGIFKNLLFFATPLILGNLLQQMYNAVDSIIVGNYVGSNALAAVGAGASLIYLLIAFSLGASVGAGVIVSQYLGAKEKEGVHKAVHTAMTISIILGLILTAMLVVPVLELLDKRTAFEEIYHNSVYKIQVSELEEKSQKVQEEILRIDGQNDENTSQNRRIEVEQIEIGKESE